MVEVDWSSEGWRRTTQFDANDYTSGHIQVFPAYVPYGGSWSRNVEFIHFYLEPSFISQIAYESVNPDKVELLLELKKADRLIHQIGLALRADLESDSVGDGFYADSLALRYLLTCCGIMRLVSVSFESMTMGCPNKN